MKFIRSVFTILLAALAFSVLAAFAQTPAPDGQEESKKEEKSATFIKDEGWQGDRGLAFYRTAPRTEIKEVAPDRIEITRGEVLIDSVKPVVIVTPLSETHLSHRAALLVKVQSGSERFMTLCESGSNSVDLITQNKKIKLSPGHEALVADHYPKREMTEPSRIARRRIKMHELPRDRYVVSSEFDLSTALQNDPNLYAVAHSKDKRDTDLRERIIKTAVVLKTLTGGHGAYSFSE